MRYEDVLRDVDAYEAACAERLARLVEPLPPGPQRDQHKRIGFRVLSAGLEGSFPDTEVVIVWEHLGRDPPVRTRRYALYGPYFRYSNHSADPTLPLEERELTADPRTVAADVYYWAREG